ncbi:transcriptional regulator [Halosimplex aquaticum]|uniref:Transcriptional regulator n=1 Tax=Halosimplex aquaticum TaxID=3026162 RepID=A0ABD5XTL1_9EURY|nr:transcriptional regulator [Halosimplex aquaticum]
MNEVDDAILEFFADQDDGLVLSPALIWFNLHDRLSVIEKSHETVARRMRNLEKRGLLEKVDENKGYYAMNQKGRDYLAGNLEADDLRLDDE